MTHAPLLFHDQFREALSRLNRAKDWQARSKGLLAIVRAPWKPRIALLEGLTDPTVKLNMGQTAEVLAREFGITREEQDAYAVQSHQRAAAAWEDDFYAHETVSLFPPPRFVAVQRDEGVRKNQSMAALSGLRPVFERSLGTVTAGNSSQITDGAAMLILTHREKAEAEGWPIMGYLHDWDYCGCDPARMGLGPVFCSQRLMHKKGLAMSGFQRVEINEAFAAQVLACLKAMDSESFANAHFNSKKAIGVPDMDRLNARGGAIAVGHPIGMTGARLILTLLSQLKHDTGGGLGLATLCIGGGQGGAVLAGSEAWKR